MYNIDFKVSGQFLSISVSLNDSIESLVQRMHELDAFKRFSRSQLQKKLLECLQKVMINPKIELRIRKQIQELCLTKKNHHQIKNINKPIQRSTSKKQTHKNINNTFVNILQQSSINTQNLLLYKNPQSQKLNRKYLINEQKQVKGGIQNKQAQKALLYKYKIDEQNILKDKQKIYIKNILNQNQQNQYNHHNNSKNQYYNYKYKHNQIENNSNNQSYSIEKFNKNYTFGGKINEVMGERPKQNYNPVPRLNQLIQKSRSLSQMIVQNDYFPHLKGKISLVQYKPQSSKLNIDNLQTKINILDDRRSSVGRIQPTRNIPTFKSKYSYL